MHGAPQVHVLATDIQENFVVVPIIKGYRTAFADPAGIGDVKRAKRIILYILHSLINGKFIVLLAFAVVSDSKRIEQYKGRTLGAAADPLNIIPTINLRVRVSWIPQ